MHLKVSHCFGGRHSFEKFKIDLKDWRPMGVMNTGDAKDKCVEIFNYSAFLVFKDIVENNETFELPTTYSACIFAKAYEGDTFRRMFTKGIFKGIDPFKTNFTGYRIVALFKTRAKLKEKVIHVTNNLKHVLYANANAGKEYY